jgi:hypothetical protein
MKMKVGIPSLVALVLLAATAFAGESGKAATSTVLGRKAAALKPGQHLDVPELKNPHSNGLDIQWMTVCAYYDAKNKEIQYMGKFASGQDPTGRFHHYVYEEKSNKWYKTGPGSLRGNGTTGHIWNTAFDFETGDYYLQPYGKEHLCKFDRAKWVAAGKPEGAPPRNKGWKTKAEKYAPAKVPPHWSFKTPTADILWTSAPNLNGMAVHPNLFGKGDKGVVACGGHLIWGYRISTNTWHQVSRDFRRDKSVRGGMTGGAGWYIPSKDSAVVGNRVIWRVPAGKDGKHPKSAEPGARTPILLRGGGGSKGGYGKQIIDPADPNRLIILEVSGKSRVWASADLGKSWTEQEFSHPFHGMRTNQWTACSISTHGVIMCLKSNRGFLARLWKLPPIKTGEKVEKKVGK